MLRSMVIFALFLLGQVAADPGIRAADEDEPTVRGKKASEWLEMLHKDNKVERDRKSTRLNSSHIQKSRMPSSA